MEIIIIRDAESLWLYGYTHWTGKPVTPKAHDDVVFVPQFDGWIALCSCGEWQGFILSTEYYGSDYFRRNGDEAIERLREAHEEHVKEVNNGD